MHMGHAHGAMRKNSHAVEEKPAGVKSQKSLCTREFAVLAPGGVGIGTSICVLDLQKRYAAHLNCVQIDAPVELMW